jgi:DNA-binding MarR family transcriptional regulator
MPNSLNNRLDDALQILWQSRQSLLRRLLKETLAADTSGRGPARHAAAVTPEQFAVITILDVFGHGVLVKEITNAVAMPHANVTRTLDKLEAKGLVRRTQGPDDRRQRLVRLTLEGAKTARRLDTIKKRLLELFWDSYDEQEKRRLLDLLSRR